MSFYASQFNNKSSRYCSSNLYGSNLSTVYSDGPPPLDDTLEEDDGEIVFRDKSPRKDSPEPKLDSDKSKSGPVSGESDFNPWSKEDNKDVAVDDFGDFSGFADFSSAFGGDSKLQNESSWFKNGDNDQSSVTNFNHNFPTHQGDISGSSRKNGEKNEGKISKDDNFGCFSGDDSDFDDYCGFTDNIQNIDTVNTKENSPKDSQMNENPESKKTIKSDEFFKNDEPLSGDSDQFNHSLEQNAKKPNTGSFDGFDNFSSSEGGLSLNGRSMSPTNNSSTSHAQNVIGNSHSAMKPTCFSDDDDDFGDFSSSSFDDDRGESTKSPELITTSQPNSDALQNSIRNEPSGIQSSAGMESNNYVTESKDSNESVQLPQYNGSETDLKQNGEDINQSDEDHDLKNTDQSKESITVDDKGNNDFGEFSTSSVTKTEEIKSKELPSDNTINDDDNDFGEFGAGTIPKEENEKNDVDDDGFGDFGAASPPSLPSLHGNSDNDNDFGDFSSTEAMSKPSSHNNGDADEFGNVGVVPTSSSSTEEKPTSTEEKPVVDDSGDFSAASRTTSKSNLKDNGSTSAATAKDDDDDFGDFGSASSTSKPELHSDKADDDDEFGDFGSVPATSKPDHPSNVAATDDDDDDFGDFGSVPVTSKPDHPGDVAATDDDDDFGDFGSVTTTSKPDLHGNNDDDDDFGDFDAAFPPSEQNKNDNFGDFAEVEQPSSKDSNSKSPSDPSSFKPKLSDDDNEFGQFDSAPSKKSDSSFAGFKSSDNTSQGFTDFSSMQQKPMTSSFSSSTNTQSFSNTDVQEQPSKLPGNSIIIKPHRNTNPDQLENSIKKCFTNKDVTIESNIIIQMLEHEVQSEKSRPWQQLLTSEKDGSLRFDWVLSEHQVKMLEGLSMLPVKIQTSVSFKPKGQVPPPLFASTMGLLEPVKGVITPFHHVEEINPSQDPFGAPPEVGVQDLGFGKGSKKETSTILHTTESKESVKDSASDTISVSSSLDLDFLAPSTTNGESTKTESRGLFEDDLLGLGMFSEPSPSPKITNGKSIFKFNNTTIPPAMNKGNLSEQAKTVVKDFEDLSFMLSKVLMFPLKSKD